MLFQLAQRFLPRVRGSTAGGLVNTLWCWYFFMCRWEMYSVCCRRAVACSLIQIFTLNFVYGGCLSLHHMSLVAVRHVSDLFLHAPQTSKAAQVLPYLCMAITVSGGFYDFEFVCTSVPFSCLHKHLDGINWCDFSGQRSRLLWYIKHIFNHTSRIRIFDALQPAQPLWTTWMEHAAWPVCGGTENPSLRLVWFCYDPPTWADLTKSS